MGEENINNIWTSCRTRNMRIRPNQELQEQYRDLDTVADIKKKRLKWTEDLLRWITEG